MKRISPKIILVGFVGILTSLFIYNYVGNNISRSKAATDTADITFTPRTGSFDIAGTTVALFIQTQESSQKISGFDITLNAKDALEIVSVGDPTFPDRPTGSVQAVKIKKDVTTTQAHLSYVFQNPSMDLPHIVQMQVVIRGRFSGQGILEIGNAQVAGTSSKSAFDLNLHNSGYNFFFPSPTPQPTATPTPFPAIQGSTWFLGGQVNQSGPNGSNVTAYATGAFPNIAYKLVSGTNGGNSSRPCSADIVAINNTVQQADANGYIANTTGVINRGLGQWQVCFYDVTQGNEGRTTTAYASFTVVDGPTQSPTAIPTIAPSPFATIVVPTTAPTRSCSLKLRGDADCNDVIDLIDFEIWRKEFTGEKVGLDADFNITQKVDLIDYEIWRKGFFREI